MRRCLPCIGWLMLTMAFFVSTLPARAIQTGDTKKKEEKKDASKDEKKPVAAKQDTKAKDKGKPKPDWNSEFKGQLTALSDKEGSFGFTVQINYKYTNVDTNAQERIAQLQQRLQQAQVRLAQANSAQARQNALFDISNLNLELSQAQARLYQVKDAKFDISCQAADKMRVRKSTPMQKIDPETGEFIKMTKELQEEAKGPEGYPGYKADTKVLQPGQFVYVYVAKDSKSPLVLLANGMKNKTSTPDIQKELKGSRCEVIMVYVVSEASK